MAEVHFSLWKKAVTAERSACGRPLRPPCQRGQLINCVKQFMSGGFSGRDVRIRPTLRRIRRNVLRIPPTSLSLGHLKVNCPEGAREATLGCPLTREAWVLPHQCAFRDNDAPHAPPLEGPGSVFPVIPRSEATWESPGAFYKSTRCTRRLPRPSASQ